MADALYDSESMRRFAGIELIEDAVPDESTILRFRHLLERHQLTQRIFERVRGLLEQKPLLLKSGTIVDHAHEAVAKSAQSIARGGHAQLQGVRQRTSRKRARLSKRGPTK